MLTQKQEKFCRTVVSGENASEAYRCAYSWENMKPATVNRRAKYLMDDGKIKARIDELMEGAAKKAQLKTQDVIESIIRLSKKAEAAERYNEALKGQELLGKYLKLWTDKTEHSGPNGGPIENKWVVEIRKANAKDQNTGETREITAPA